MVETELKIVSDEEKQERERMVTIAGGVEVTVQHLDGTRERVKVRQIPATKLEAFMTKLADEATSISIYCDKPVEWADTLEHESITEICKTGLAVNEHFLGEWCLRRAKWTEMLNVGVIADMQKKLDALNNLLASVTLPQQSPTTTISPPPK